MGVTRIRPSRNSYEVDYVTTAMPGHDGGTGATAVGKSCTLEVANVPNRGIIRSLSFYVRDQTALSDSNVNLMVVSTSGAATTALGGAAGMTETDVDNAVFVTGFKMSDAQTGSLDLTGTSTGTPNMFIIQADLLAPSANGKPPAELYYDVSSGVLGPDASDGRLYITLISGGFRFSDSAGSGSGLVNAAKLRLEIEPCF